MPLGHLLIVEDDPLTGYLAMQALLRAGYAVDLATELEEAQALLVNLRYDLVISDLRLTCIHGAEGLEVLRCVRSHSPSTRTILLTAHGSGELAREALRLGADRVLDKPLPTEQLVTLVGELAARGPTNA